MNDITVLVIIKDAEATLDTCLSSVDWADDIFCVIDPSSSDRSMEIARTHTSHVLENEFIGPGQQRNWAIPQITTEWTLVLDSDEWVLEPLRERIQQIIKNPESLNGYSIKRLTYFFGRLIKHCGWHRDYNIRLFRTKHGRYDDRRVHESLIIDGEVGKIHEVMIHDTYRSMDGYVTTMNRYSTWGADDRFEKGKKLHATDLFFRPAFSFFKMYVLRHGFLDGIHGFILCVLSAFSVFLKYAKVWNLERMRRAGEEIVLTPK